MSVGRQELIRRLQSRVNQHYRRRQLPPYLVREALEALLQLIQEALKTEGKVKISGFGTFEVVTTKEKKGRDFRKGTLLSIPPRQKVVFHPSPLLLKKLKGFLNE